MALGAMGAGQALVRDTQPEVGDVLLDPLCGCGTIGEVAAHEWRGRLYCISGDRSEVAVERAAHNAALRPF